MQSHITETSTDFVYTLKLKIKGYYDIMTERNLLISNIYLIKK